MADNKFTYTIDNADIDSELTNFPVVIQLDSSCGKNLFDATAIFTELPNTDDWKKIKITDALDNILYTEIEVWDVANERATLHVKAPTVSDGSNTVLTVDFDSSNSDNSTYIGIIGSTPGQNVWDSNFVFVSHQAQDPSGTAPQILDSTSYAKNGTSYGTMLSEDLIDGVTGKMIDYDGADDYTNHGYDAAHDIIDTLTLEASFTPNILLDSSATNYSGLVSRASIDSYSLSINSDGKLHSGSSGGSIQGTKASWAANQNFIVASTYNVTGLIGDLFVDGTKEIITVDGYDTMVGGTSDVIIGTLLTSGHFLQGAIGKVRVSNIIRSDDWIGVTALSVTDTLFTVADYEISAAITTVLSQTYDLERFVHLAVLSQLYDIQYVILQVLEQPYSEEFLAILSQTYGNMPTRTAVLTQYYTNLADVIAVLEQKYGNMSCVLAIIEQEYNLNADLLAILEQKYSLTFPLQPAILSQLYDLELRNKLLSVLSQPYSLFQGIDPIEHVVWVTINGVRVKVTKISYNYNIDNYCADFQITLALYDEWLMVEEFMAVVIHINETEHNVIVVNTNSQLSVQSSSYPIECKSQAILLDFPFATNIKDTFIVNGFASQVVNDLANLEGLSITWHMLSDPPLTATDISVIGSSPLGAIRSIVNEIGGKINSHPDGSIHVVRRQPFDSDKYHLLTPTIELTTGIDYITLNTNTDKRDGYNKFSVSNEDYHDGYDLVTDALDNGSYNALSYKVPWSSKQLQLHTSEITNVVIIDHNIITEPITQEIEIVEGKGKVSKPCYGGISYDYKDALNLGSISIKEDGTVTTSISGHTIVTVTYDTRYWLWNVSNTDSESVQLLLVEI